MAQDMRVLKKNGNRKLCVIIVDMRRLCAHTTITEKEHHMSIAAIVTSQARAEWPAKQYHFTDQFQARMFLAMCKRDGDFRCSLRLVAPSHNGAAA